MVLAAAILWEDRDIFRVASYEQADDAANALSINRAKHGDEIYGNYSRFNFRHPGPAFVYVYAAGEIVLEDWLGAISPRQNAHILTGILLQVSFLALAIGISASYARSPWRAMWLLAGIALVHFSFVPGAFTRIWPPLVLIMPFALFIVAAASVASGRTGHLVWLALSAGFLLHGHIAQFLFVGIILAAVVGAILLRRLGGGSQPLPSRPQVLILALIAALTALPWVIDATRGRESNIFNIWLHIKRSANDPLRPGWLVSLEDTCSYFCYCTRQNDWFSPGASLTLLQFVKAYGSGIGAALVALASCGYVLWHGRRTRVPSAIFQRYLAGMCALAALLCVIWARRQDGGVAYFNSLFIFGLMMAIWVIPGLGIAENATGSATALILGALLVSFALAGSRYSRIPDFMESGDLGREAALKVPYWLSKEAHPGRPKLIIFSHDDWGEAVAVAAALNRLGFAFYVPESDSGIWKQMFGEDHVIQSLEQARSLRPFSWWRPALGRRDEPRLVGELGDDSAGHERSRFPFNFDLRHPKESFGLSKPESEMTWTESRVVLMRLWSEPARSDVRMTLRASALPFVHGFSQRVRIMVNGTLLPEFVVSQLSDYSVAVPKGSWNAGATPGLVDLEWGLPDSYRLEALPGSKYPEARLLGVCLYSLKFQLVDGGR